MRQNLYTEQKQILQLSPQMYQSIKILQLNSMELNSWLEKEVQENPVLEVNFNQSPSPGSDEGRGEKDAGIETNVRDENTLLEYFSSRKGLIKDKSVPAFVREQEVNRLKEGFCKISLSEHLLLNFRVIARDELESKIGEYLIGNINYNGYLAISCQEAAQDLNIGEKKVRQVLAMIQNCSIPGIGARNLKECLLLQLKHLQLSEKSILRDLILFHLDKLSKKDFNDIGRELKLSCSEIQHLLDILKKYFDPKPGRIFFQDYEINYLIPDIIVKKINNQYEIFENGNFSPDVRINLLYERMLLDYKRAEKLKNQELLSQEKWAETKATVEYLKGKISSARWVIRCLEQRRNTIINITRFIIDYQNNFLEKGVTYLKPLSLEEASQYLGLNKSTVSRAIKSKKVQLPRGIYNLKYFFSKGLLQENRASISNEKIKNVIRNYIEREDSYKPYSDQKLTDLLQEGEGIKVARRTVTKYRKLMNIPSAKLRRRFK